MNNKNKIITGILIFTIGLLFVIGLSYAYFSANLSGGEDTTTITVSGGTMNIYYSGGVDIIANNIRPANEPFATKTFTITGNNTTDLEMYYEVSLVVEENTFSEWALKYKLISTNTDNSGENIPSRTQLNKIGTGPKKISLGVGNFAVPTGGNKLHTYNLELYFPETNTNQNVDQGKTFKAHLEIKSSDEPLPLLTDLIIAQGGGVNTIIARGTPDFNVINGTSGIYAAEDDYGISYYYRGIKEELNNNLIWGGLQWKIVRINGDGSIRLVYNGTEAQFNTNGTMNTTGSSTEITSTPWNQTYFNDAKYVGYMYGGANGVASTIRDGVTSAAATYNQTSTNIKTTIDNWYKTNIIDNGYADLIVDNLFCNDRQLQSEIGGPATGPGFGKSVTLTFYAPYNRLYTNKTPTLKCGLQNDRFTVNDTTLGNGALTYPVGLLTADEASYAGLKFNTSNKTNYLYTNSLYWLFSPVIMESSGGAILMTIDSSGFLFNDLYFDSSVEISKGVRPTVSLSSFAEATGTGSVADPFKV